jgi:hypothetical protein
LRGISECKDRRGLASLDEDRERSRRLREDIMFLEGTAVIEEGIRRASCFCGGKGVALRCQCPNKVVNLLGEGVDDASERRDGWRGG